ncbi:MAG TPA: hypothetical protein VI968_01165 [archaeon]|nr:hypothetical protein [archaeon]
MSYSDLAKNLGTVLLAGLTSLSSPDAFNYKTSGADSFGYKTEAKKEGRSAYAKEVDSWFAGLQRTHGKYLSGMRDLRSVNLSDDALEMLAFAVYDKVNSAATSSHKAENEYCDIIQARLPDGSFLWTDMISGHQLKATRTGSHYNFRGPSYLIQKLGGRGELSGLMKMLEDDDPNHDYPLAAKKTA